MGLIEVDYFSNSLKRKVRFKVYVPHNPNSILMLLHGAGDNLEAWINYTNVIRYNKNHLLIFPSGDMSFYVNRKHGEQFRDYLVELLDYCQKRFVIKTNDIYVAGNSMGGYGTLNLFQEIPDRIKKIGLFSPALDLNEKFLDKFQDKSLKNNVTNPLDGHVNIVNSKIFLYCGVNDYLFNSNKLFASKYDLKLLKDDGAHDWDSWDNIIKIFLEEIDVVSTTK